MNNNVKTDCFAYENNSCTAINTLLCQKGKCRFYKTQRQLNEQLKKCADRLELNNRPVQAEAIRKILEKNT